MWAIIILVMSHFLKGCTIECNPSLLRLCLFLLILLQHLSRFCSLSIILKENKERLPSPKCPYLPPTLSSFSIHSSRKDCMPCLTSSALSSLSPREPIASPPDLSVSRGFPALTSQSLQWPCWAPLSSLWLSLSLCCLPVWCLHAGAAWVSSSPSHFLSVLPPLPCPDSGLYLEYRFRFPAAYWPSQLRCLLGFQTQHATNRMHHLSPQTCAFPLALL